MKSLTFNQVRFVFQAGKHLPYVLMLIINKEARQAENTPQRLYSKFVILMLHFLAEFFCRLSRVVRILLSRLFFFPVMCCCFFAYF